MQLNCQSRLQSCARLRKESRRCLNHSKKLTTDRADVVKGLKEQLDAMQVKKKELPRRVFFVGLL